MKNQILENEWEECCAGNKLTNVEGEVFAFLLDRSSHKSDLSIMRKSVDSYAGTSPECFSFPT